MSLKDIWISISDLLKQFYYAIQSLWHWFINADLLQGLKVGLVILILYIFYKKLYKAREKISSNLYSGSTNPAPLFVVSFICLCFGIVLSLIMGLLGYDALLLLLGLPLMIIGMIGVFTFAPPDK